MSKTAKQRKPKPKRAVCCICLRRRLGKYLVRFRVTRWTCRPQDISCINHVTENDL